MPEEAKVILSAVDNVSGPASLAADSLQKYQGAVDSLSALLGQQSGGVNPAYIKSMEATSTTIAGAGTNARVARAGLSVLTQGLVEATGGSQAAYSAMRVLDSGIIATQISGASLSLAFGGIVAAATAIGYVFRQNAEATKTKRDELEKLTASSIAYIKTLDVLDRGQKAVAGVGMAELSSRLMREKQDIQELTEKMDKNAAAAVAMSKAQAGSGAASPVQSLSLFAASAVSGSGDTAANTDQMKMASELRILQDRAKETQHEMDALASKTKGYQATVQTLASSTLPGYISQMDRQASEMEALGQIVGSTEFNYEALSAGAAKAGISVQDAAKIMVAQNKIVENGVFSLASAFGQTLGNAIMKGKNAWQEGLKAMVGAVFDAATQVLIAAAIMNKGLSAALIPFSFGAILAMVAVVQGLKMIAMSALTSQSSGLESAAPTSLAGGVGGSASGSGVGTAASGPGGSAISSAAKEVVNNITVNLPIQALDLQSISDITMKSFATRIGRIIADGAGQGQFSLAGA